MHPSYPCDKSANHSGLFGHATVYSATESVSRLLKNNASLLYWSAKVGNQNPLYPISLGYIIKRSFFFAIFNDFLLLIFLSYVFAMPFLLQFAVWNTLAQRPVATDGCLAGQSKSEA
jgi:hypothetical protein